MRKLARIETIQSILPIKNADFIEAVVISNNEWKIVVRKDDHLKVGDMVMYFEIGSYLSIEPRYEFLRKSSYKKLDFKDGNPKELRDEGFLVGIPKLRGIWSMGLVMPLIEFKKEIKEHFPRLCGEDTDGWRVDKKLLGTDFTDILGVKPFKAPILKDQKYSINIIGFTPSCQDQEE